MISGTAGGPVRRAGPARGAAAWGWCAVAPGGVWEARAQGDEVKAGQYEQSAQAFAGQLVTAEQSVEDMKTLHDQAIQAAGQAKQAVERNALALQQKIAERTKLLSQLEQAKMQEQASASLRQMSELSAPGNTPSLEEVRDKIERRYANAVGAGELAQNSVQGRMLEVQHTESRELRAVRPLGMIQDPSAVPRLAHRQVRDLGGMAWWDGLEESVRLVVLESDL